MSGNEGEHKEFISYLSMLYPFADKSRKGEGYADFHTQKLWLAFLDSKHHTYSHHRNFNDDFNKIFGGNK
jgi:hypothetical protein